jgi:hypothetical protein
MVYKVEFQDGHRTSPAIANAIADNLFAQIDDEGNRYFLSEEIVDFRTDGKQMLRQQDINCQLIGTQRRRETTLGWEILLRWKDRSTTWVALEDMKESYPVQLAEYVDQARIAEETAFACWWVPYTTLRKCNRMIIAKVKSKYWIRTRKFGIKIPKNVAEACSFDAENGGNTSWWDAIEERLPCL